MLPRQAREPWRSDATSCLDTHTLEVIEAVEQHLRWYRLDARR